MKIICHDHKNRLRSNFQFTEFSAYELRTSLKSVTEAALTIFMSSYR